MKIINSFFSDCYIFTNKRFNDKRGFFTEIYNEKEINSHKRNQQFNCKQINFIFSNQNSLRGMHFQKKPFSQKKILRVIEGKIFDVVLDIRKKSKTFGQYRTFILSEQNKKQIFIGEGFAHGYMTLSKTAKVEYLCSNFYRSDYESCIKWDDPDINIKWPKDKKFLISPKDEKGIFFSEI